jgi:hypothetical protein
MALCNQPLHDVKKKKIFKILEENNKNPLFF